MPRTVVVEQIADTRNAVTQARGAGKKIGLVPTMGALHAGHVSLIRAARAGTDFVVVSVFVNPTQFGPNEDFERYPRPFARDVEICNHESVDLIFHPAVETLYPPGFRTYAAVLDFQERLCGASRPGHFRGVTTVVLKLFNIVQPDVAYFGQKDAQQARIIQQLVQDLDVAVKIQVEPIVREPDGLALSSRNEYLDPEQRRNAVVLPRTLAEVRELVTTGERHAPTLVDLMVRRITATPGAVLDYAAVVDYANLQPLERLAGRVLVALAVRFGRTRLIDNVLLDVV